MAHLRAMVRWAGWSAAAKLERWHQLDAVVLSPCEKMLDSGGRLPSRKSSQGPISVPKNSRRLMLARPNNSLGMMYRHALPVAE
jgi:hypothetical protein